MMRDHSTEDAFDPGPHIPQMARELYADDLPPADPEMWPQRDPGDENDHVTAALTGPWGRVGSLALVSFKDGEPVIGAWAP